MLRIVIFLIKMKAQAAGEGAASRGVWAGVCHAHGPARPAAHFVVPKSAGGGDRAVLEGIAACRG